MITSDNPHLSDLQSRLTFRRRTAGHRPPAYSLLPLLATRPQPAGKQGLEARWTLPLLLKPAALASSSSSHPLCAASSRAVWRGDTADLSIHQASSLAGSIESEGPTTTSRMEGRSANEISSAEAILVGALSSGVNAPTWFVLKITFLLLALCFTAMLSLAFVSSDFVIIGHVLLLVTIGTVLFVLLNRFLTETGLVPVEQQMKEVGIHKTEATEKDKRN